MVAEWGVSSPVWVDYNKNSFLSLLGFVLRQEQNLRAIKNTFTHIQQNSADAAWTEGVMFLLCEYKHTSDRIFTCDGYFTVHFLQLGFYFRTTEEFNVLSLVLSCLWVFVWVFLTCLSNFKLCVFTCCFMSLNGHRWGIYLCLLGASQLWRTYKQFFTIMIFFNKYMSNDISDPPVIRPGTLGLESVWLHSHYHAKVT